LHICSGSSKNTYLDHWLNPSKVPDQVEIDILLIGSRTSVTPHGYLDWRPGVRQVCIAYPGSLLEGQFSEHRIADLSGGAFDGMDQLIDDFHGIALLHHNSLPCLWLRLRFAGSPRPETIPLPDLKPENGKADLQELP
jgi:hypothetical protein